METFTVPFIFCSVLTLVGGGPVAPVDPVNVTFPRVAGLCHYIRDQANHDIGEFIPKCDIYGNFQPQQCWAATGSCWCVNILTGQEVPHTRTPPGTTPVNCDGEFYCPDGWSHFRGQCLIFIDHAVKWVEAETHCLFEGANLASVHSYEQNHFIQALIRGEGFIFTQTWIGGHNVINHHVWLWSDGSKFNYENWNKHDDQEQKNSCLMMNYGYEYKWFPHPCNETLPFVCVKTTST